MDAPVNWGAQISGMTEQTHDPSFPTVNRAEKLQKHIHVYTTVLYTTLHYLRKHVISRELLYFFIFQLFQSVGMFAVTFHSMTFSFVFCCFLSYFKKCLFHESSCAPKVPSAAVTFMDVLMKIPEQCNKHHHVSGLKQPHLQGSVKAPANLHQTLWCHDFIKTKRSFPFSCCNKCLCLFSNLKAFPSAFWFFGNVRQLNFSEAIRSLSEVHEGLRLYWHLWRCRALNIDAVHLFQFIETFSLFSRDTHL